VRKPEGRRPLLLNRRRCEDNIKMDRREIELGGMNSNVVSQDRDQWKILCKYGNNPSCSKNIRKFLSG
jgi:hypothetical protein